VVFLVSLLWSAGFGIWYLIPVSLIALLYVLEHRIVKPDDITNIDIAFFHINSIISVLVFVAILTGYLTVK
jgi:4-hydroxybenzoate polyprenyltransferase